MLENGYTRRALVNYLLFQELHGKDVVLEIFEGGYEDSYSGSLVLKPFQFNWDGGKHEHVFTDGNCSGVIDFDARKPMVHINYMNDSTGVYSEWSYHVETIIATMTESGAVHLNLIRHPLFDIDVIRGMYDQFDEVKPEWMDALRMELHPITQVTSSFGIIKMLYDLDVSECFMLTQLAHNVRFEIESRTIRELNAK